MKGLFFCYDGETYLVDKMIDQVHIATLVSFLIIVFLDWPYWKTAPYSVHTFIVHGIVFTFLFLRFC
jgi:predicted membrane chloride channel (bestrophin family)